MGEGAAFRPDDTGWVATWPSRSCCLEVAGTPTALSRFSREAKVLASLNHPNIAQIHGFESTSQTRHWSWSLWTADAGRSDCGGATPVTEALSIAQQIARGARSRP